VSFAALPVGESAYLVEKGPLLHYLSAERDLAAPLASPRGAEGLIALGAPAYNETDVFAGLSGKEQAPLPTPSPAQVASLRPFRGQRSGCGDFTTLKFEPLPGTGPEVEEVTRLYTASAPNTRSDAPASLLLTRNDASEAAFKAQAPGHRILHLATHGFFLGGKCRSALDATRGIGGLKAAPPPDTLPPLAGENPLLLSGLALAGANHRDAAGPDEDDGILTAEEIAAMDLAGTEWAVLSACDTGIGTIQAGEGVFGLRRAFQIAGAQTVIMSLWAVEDESARQWMKALYEGRLLKHLDTATAVRNASLSVLKSRRARGESTHPFYWAGFVAAGEWR